MPISEHDEDETALRATGNYPLNAIDELIVGNGNTIEYRRFDFGSGASEMSVPRGMVRLTIRFSNHSSLRPMIQ